MPGAYRVVLRSTETKPSQETQESVLPALSQKFGSRVDIHAADISPDDRLQAARIGTATVTDPDVLCEVYEYLKPNRLVKIAGIQTDDDTGVVRRKLHEVDRETVDNRPDVRVIGAVDGDLLMQASGDDRG
jgi:hypothetical protein